MRQSKTATLEIISSPGNCTPAQCSSPSSNHLTKATVSPPRQGFGEQKFFLFFGWDEDMAQEDSEPWDCQESEALNLAKSNDISGIECRTMPSEPDMPLSETLDVHDTSDTEAEDVLTESGLSHAINRPVFGSPALKLVWENFMQRYESALRGSRTLLRETARMVYGPSYERGTAHAVGIWANYNNPPVWLRLWNQPERENNEWLFWRSAADTALLPTEGVKNRDETDQQLKPAEEIAVGHVTIDALGAN
ncbi:hypothetical protein DL768_001913 [Monosporascus sp. mg162]|nr:hypothetical protein DL768_001913 [Monosporascus sp. mg162]